VIGQGWGLDATTSPSSARPGPMTCDRAARFAAPVPAETGPEGRGQLAAGWFRRNAARPPPAGDVRRKCKTTIAIHDKNRRSLNVDRRWSTTGRDRERPNRRNKEKGARPSSSGVACPCAAGRPVLWRESKHDAPLPPRFLVVRNPVGFRRMSLTTKFDRLSWRKRFPRSYLFFTCPAARVFPPVVQGGPGARRNWLNGEKSFVDVPIVT